MPAKEKSIALIGARGHTGMELIRLIGRHPCFALSLAGSRKFASERVSDLVEGFSGDLCFSGIEPGHLADAEYDAVILALSNRASDEYVNAIDRRGDETVIIDLSADHRFDDGWVYGLPEHFRDAIRTARRIANPGCYATGMMLALCPVVGLLDGPPQVFGVSGYSGAGATPSERNDPDKLHDNLMPYALGGHTHEREVTRHLHHPVRFFPHVAPFFRGISLTISMNFTSPQSFDSLAERYHRSYDAEPLVSFRTDIPQIRDIAEQPHCLIGGLTIDASLPTHAVVVAVIDNLLKGAATQAMQNLNLAFGFEELIGVDAGKLTLT